MANIRICPKCKKPTLKQATNVSGWLAPEMFECTNCDYIGSFFLEIDSDDYKLTEENETKDNKEDNKKGSD
ncbi:MAG: hypothetical protein EU550_02360 [Promethearchaeota archaeon]|nr:MAG: hypothetical protein EU550_02360 [Candidatus Lokiarchaeota archaeon]